MGLYMWVKVFLFFVMLDFKSFPNRIGIIKSRFILWYKKVKFRKIYEEKNLFFIIIFLPSLIFRRWQDQRIANLSGITLERFYEEQINKIIFENESRRQNIQMLKLKNMRDLADLIPGATVHDYNFLEKQPIFSVRFVLSSLKGGKNGG